MTAPKRQPKTYHADLPPLRPCGKEGCEAHGEYRAPKSRENLTDYQWLCLTHVKEYNKKWDYFADMSMEEIEHFTKEAVTGHRPTWEREDHIKGRYARYAHLLQEELQHFFHGAKKSEPPRPRLPARERKALAVMELTESYDATQLKNRYRELVKRYHPDLNQGDKTCEAKFKEIAVAYAYLTDRQKKTKGGGAG